MIFYHKQPFRLESGAVLPEYHLAYTTYGALDEGGDNVVWVFHALTANSDPAEWWPGLVGRGRLFDPSRWFIVCVNMPGSCYGSTGPMDLRPGTDHSWNQYFPFFTPRDMARAFQPLREFLGIQRIHTGIGGSMGGQQLLEWAILEPGLFEHIIPIATNAQHSPWGIAFNTAQRMAIEADPSFHSGGENAGSMGMRAARAMALLSYRHYDAYRLQQPRLENYLAETFPPAPFQSPAPLSASPDSLSGESTRTGSIQGDDTSPDSQPDDSTRPAPIQRHHSSPGDSTRPGSIQHNRAPADSLPRDGASSYQRYQGEKLVKRFNAYSYYALSLSMDAHDVSRNRGTLEQALGVIKARTLVIGITSDILFPLSEQQLLAALIPGAAYRQIASLYGHDGFLLEYAQIESLLKEFFQINNHPYAIHHSTNS